ncbi:Uncharacterised protein [Streptococcus pneumoniae]|nr:Uncharacterised protein [Streptococcus pneumoniae]
MYIYEAEAIRYGILASARCFFIIERFLFNALLFSKSSYKNVYGFVILTKSLLPIAAVVPIAVNATAETIETIKNIVALSFIR